MLFPSPSSPPEKIFLISLLWWKNTFTKVLHHTRNSLFILATDILNILTIQDKTLSSKDSGGSFSSPAPMCQHWGRLSHLDPMCWIQCKVRKTSLWCGPATALFRSDCAGPVRGEEKMKSESGSLSPVRKPCVCEEQGSSSMGKVCGLGLPQKESLCSGLPGSSHLVTDP